MMRIRLLTVGKIKEKYLQEGIREYEKRLSAFANVETVEIPDEKVPDKPSPAEEEAIKKREGERLLAAAGRLAGTSSKGMTLVKGAGGKSPANKALTAGKEADVLVALDLGGKEWTSEELSAWLEKQALEGKSKIDFVIGGTLGLSNEVIQAADVSWRLSKLTFPHQLIRLFLLEQVYRGFKIARGGTYHR